MINLIIIEIIENILFYRIKNCILQTKFEYFLLFNCIIVFQIRLVIFLINSLIKLNSFNFTLLLIYQIRCFFFFEEIISFDYFKERISFMFN